MTKPSSSSGVPVQQPRPEARPALAAIPLVKASAGARFKRERTKSPAHEQFIRSLPCVVCGDNTTTECAHVSYADRRYGKFGRGLGQKEESIWTVPLCGHHHREQHHDGELHFWRTHKIDPCRVAVCLFVRTQDHATALEIIDHARS